MSTGGGEGQGRAGWQGQGRAGRQGQGRAASAGGAGEEQAVWRPRGPLAAARGSKLLLPQYALLLLWRPGGPLLLPH